MELTGPIMICRSAEPPEPIDPRFSLGYQCAGCGQKLQVSPTGLAVLLRQNGVPLCNPCGTEIMRKIDNDPAVEATLVIGPEAQRFLKATTGQDATELFPNAQCTSLTPEEFLQKGRH